MTASLPIGEIPARFLRRGSMGLVLLLDAFEYSVELSKSAWDFAVEIGSLHRTGLTRSDLRWLACKGFVDHAHEITTADDAGRRFQQASRLSLKRKSCFILTLPGVIFARGICSATTSRGAPIPQEHARCRPLGVPKTARSKIGSTPGQEGISEAATSGVSLERIQPGRIGNGEMPRAVQRPTWDADRRQLRLGDVIVKEFRVPAENQQTVLQAFESVQWPPRVRDPLPPLPDVDAKRRLRSTINSLNHRQKKFLIRFLGDGNGEGVRWELA